MNFQHVQTEHSAEKYCNLVWNTAWPEKLRFSSDSEIVVKFTVVLQIFLRKI